MEQLKNTSEICYIIIIIIIILLLLCSVQNIVTTFYTFEQ